jgi:branched-chain amino acid transport system ATP-binding protein
MVLLKVEGISKSYGGVHAAREITFELDRGELLALIGPNGAGKSTTFGMVGGQLRPDSGRILLDGSDVTGMEPRKVARFGVGRTFQVASVFSSMTVIENVRTAICACRGMARSAIRPARALFHEEVMNVLSLTGMADLAERRCATLSYGDIKRAELAIALAGKAKLLLMDEPTAGMAPRERAALMELVSKLAKERNIGVLFTEHDMESVFGHADRVIVVVRGKIIAEGSPEEVSGNDNVRTLYLGESGVTAVKQVRRTK